MKKRKRICHGLLAWVLSLTIISLSIVGTLAFRPLYYMDIALLNIPEQSGCSVEKIRENYDALIDYNLSFGDERLEFPSLAMSEPGRIHFEEVKAIFDIFKYMAAAGTLLSAAGILFFHKKRESLYLKKTAILTAALPVILGLYVALGWERAFVAFHHVFFNNDYWLFDPLTDPVITILPDTFFLHCALLILGGVLIGSVICAILYRKNKTAC